MERQLIADQALWRRVPAAVTALLAPLAVLSLGWGSGWWVAIAAAVSLGVASVIVPPRLRVSIYLIDLLERLVRLPLVLCWLLPVWHLWMREPLFPVLGQPIPGAIAMTAVLLVGTRLLAFLARFSTKRVMSDG